MDDVHPTDSPQVPEVPLPTYSSEPLTPPESFEPVPAPGEPPAPTPKPKTDVLFFILGLFTPYVLGGILIGIGSVVAATLYSNVDSSMTPLMSALLGIGPNVIVVLMFFGFLAMWLSGRKNGNVRLASYGKGGMWSYAVGVLLALLAFGTCLIGLSGMPQ